MGIFRGGNISAWEFFRVGIFRAGIYVGGDITVHILRVGIFRIGILHGTGFQDKKGTVVYE